MALGLTRFLPRPMRMRVQGLLHNAKVLRRSVLLPIRPAFASRYTEEELSLLSEEWAARQRELVFGARVLRAEVWTAEVREVLRETPDAVTLVCSREGGGALAFGAGQFVTMVVHVEGQELRRAYSFCSDPAETSQFSITVKRVPGGQVSNLINDKAEVGWRFKAQGPSGRFGDVLPGKAASEVVLVAGGVGSTPLLSMAYEQLRRAPETPLAFVYANRDAQSILFREALLGLCEKHPNMQLLHVLEDATDAPAPGCERERFVEGRLADDALGALLPPDSAAHYFVCGPTGLMESVREHLVAGGVAPTQVTQETFVDQSGTQRKGATGAVHEVRLSSGETRQVSDDQTLLEAGIAAGWPMDFSCQMGGCAACRVKLIEGEVEMEEPNCLTPQEREEGYCLACIARPRSAVVIDV